MKWFRHYHGCLSDPKFGSIARKTGQTRERAVFVWLAILESASEADTRGTVTTDIEAIADTLNCDDADVQTIWDQFVERGMIRDGVVSKWDERNPARDDSAARQRAKRDRDADVTRTPRDSDAHVTRLDTDTDTDTSKKEKTPARKRAGYDQDFEDWWKVYPHKVGKDAAAKAYHKALTRTDSQTLLAKAQAFAAEQSGKDPQYIAHPSTWLNQGRWMDEPAGRSPPDSPEADRPRAGGNPPWAKWRAHLTFTRQTDTLKEFKQFQEAHGFDAANQRAIADAKQAGVPL